LGSYREKNKNTEEDKEKDDKKRGPEMDANKAAGGFQARKKVRDNTSRMGVKCGKKVQG